MMKILTQNNINGKDQLEAIIRENMRKQRQFEEKRRNRPSMDPLENQFSFYNGELNKLYENILASQLDDNKLPERYLQHQVNRFLSLSKKERRLVQKKEDEPKQIFDKQAESVDLEPFSISFDEHGLDPYKVIKTSNFSYNITEILVTSLQRKETIQKPVLLIYLKYPVKEINQFNNLIGDEILGTSDIVNRYGSTKLDKLIEYAASKKNKAGLLIRAQRKKEFKKVMVTYKELQYEMQKKRE